MTTLYTALPLQHTASSLGVDEWSMTEGIIAAANGTVYNANQDYKYITKEYKSMIDLMIDCYGTPFEDIKSNIITMRESIIKWNNFISRINPVYYSIPNVSKANQACEKLDSAINKMIEYAKEKSEQREVAA